MANNDYRPIIGSPLIFRFDYDLLCHISFIFCFDLKNSEKRTLAQYHFLTWPDFGVPEEVEHILDFVTEVRKRFRGTAPMLVHCR